MYITNSLEASVIHAPCIVEWENVWQHPDKIIDEIESTVENSKSIFFEDATVTRLDGTVEKATHRTNTSLWLERAAFQDDFFRNLNNDFFLTLLAASQWYRTKYDIHENFEHIEGYNLLRYQAGEEFKAHYDGGISSGRSISPIIYLNDDYEGGELEFVNFGIKIKPKAGSLYIFPATFPYAHIAHPVTKGTKYAIVTWLHEVNN
jgi:hypothetical protein